MRTEHFCIGITQTVHAHEIFQNRNILGGISIVKTFDFSTLLKTLNIQSVAFSPLH